MRPPWRGIQLQPRLTAEYADWPVSELDLHARHAWLEALCQAHGGSR